ncbi:MAG: hypothetical protein DHS20C17_29130 [Cyclobacteriaceae bacterium]|nr:MAG: hypothetical protein DHS20C17_29130 [Cyclobacteriaceae bacterium]
MLLLAIVLALLSIIIDLSALILLRFPETGNVAESTLPNVSILVPMFNEESNVDALIKNLQMLDYPAGNFEILIGEDRSTDKTPEKLRVAASQDVRIKVVTIEKDIPGLLGKANVIAQLIPHSTTEFYFITDADVRVPSAWVKTVLANYHSKVGVIGGITVVPVSSLWSGLQNIDWLLAQGLIHVAGQVFQTVAVSGTNMMVSRDACATIGGYANIPYPLTEDIGLLTAVKNMGFTGKNLIHAGCTAVTNPCPGVGSLLQQRSRWIYGVLKLPWYIIALLIIRASFLLLVALILLWQPITGFILLGLKMGIDLLLVRRIARRVRADFTVWHFLFFEVYWFSMSMCGLFMHLFSVNTNWKGRDYQ